MDHFPNSGAQYSSIYAQGSGYTPEAPGGMLGGAVSMAASFLGGSDGITRNPFVASGGNDAQIRAAQSLSEAIQTSRRESAELLRVDSQRINAVTQTLARLTADGPLSAEQKLYAAQQAERVTQFLQGPVGGIALGALGIDQKLLFPNIDLPNQITGLLRQVTNSSEINSGLVGQLSADIGKIAGIKPDGSLIPQLSQGFTASQQASITSQLYSHGMLGIDSNLARINSNDPATLRASSNALAGQIAEGLKEVLPAFATARATFGTSDAASLFNKIQSATGGGIGQLSGSDIQTQMSLLQNMSSMYGASTDSLLSYVNDIGSAARSNNLDATAASRNALNNFGTGLIASRRSSLALEGSNLYGVNRSATAILDRVSQNMLGAQASPLASRAAVALSDLETFANNTGRTIDSLADDLSGTDQSVVNALMDLNSGNISGSTLDLLSNENAVANTLANITGQSLSTAFNRINNKTLAQRGLAKNPGLVSGTEGLQTLEITDLFSEEIEDITGVKLNKQEQAAALAAARVYGGDSEAFINEISRLSEREGYEGLSQLEPSWGDIIGNYSRSWSYSGAKALSTQDMLTNLETLALNSPLDDQSALAFLSQGESMSSAAMAQASARSAAQYNRTVGGLPAFEQALQGYASGGIGGAAGYVSPGQMAYSLASNTSGDDLVSQLSASSGVDVTAGIDNIASMLSRTPEQYDYVSANLQDIMQQGSSSSRERDMRDFLYETSEMASVPEYSSPQGLSGLFGGLFDGIGGLFDGIGGLFGGAAGYASPEYAFPEYASPEYAFPEYASPEYASPEYAFPEYAPPEYAFPEYAFPAYAPPEYALPEYASPEYVSPGQMAYSLASNTSGDDLVSQLSASSGADVTAGIDNIASMLSRTPEQYDYVSANLQDIMYYGSSSSRESSMRDFLYETSQKASVAESSSPQGLSGLFGELGHQIAEALISALHGVNVIVDDSGGPVQIVRGNIAR